MCASKDLDTHTGALCLVRDLGGLEGTYFQVWERSCMQKREKGHSGCRDFSRPTQKPEKTLPAHISITDVWGRSRRAGAEAVEGEE